MRLEKFVCGAMCSWCFMGYAGDTIFGTKLERSARQKRAQTIQIRVIFRETGSAGRSEHRGRSDNVAALHRNLVAAIEEDRQVKTAKVQMRSTIIVWHKLRTVERTAHSKDMLIY